MRQLFRARPAQHPVASGSPDHTNARAMLETAGVALLVGAAYYVGAKIGFILTPYPNPISTLWPPNAILFASLLLAPRRMWGPILLAVLPAHLLVQLQSGVPIPTALGWFISNTGEALLGAFLVLRFTKCEAIFKSFRGVNVFVIFGVLAAPLVTSFLDAAFVVLTGWGSNYWLLWRERLFSNMLANLTLVPVIVHAGTGGLARARKMPRRAMVEASLLAIALVLVTTSVFGGTNVFNSSGPVLIYAPLPLLLWAAVRFEPCGVSSGLLIVALLAIWNAIHGHGPFTADTSAQNVFFLQIFLIVLQAPLIYLAALIEERKHIARSLRVSEERYRNVMQTQTELICRFLPDATLTFVNDAYCRYFNKTSDELIGTKFIELIPESSRSAALKHIESLIASPRVEAHEHEVSKPDGSTGWQRWVDHVILNSAGQVVEIQGIGRDFTDLKNAEESLEHLTARLLNMQDEERRRIARELHDVTAQNLFALTVKLASLEQHGHSLTAEGKKRLSESLTLGEQILQEIRTLSYLLHPPLLDQAGLVSALKWYVEDFTAHSGIKVELLTSPSVERLPSEVETALFRIVQEGLRSIRRHSGSRTASISLERRDHEVILQIKDQSRSLSIKGVSPPEDFRLVGVGIRGIRQRLQHLGGRLEISSDTQGINITALVPLAREEHYGSHFIS